jgi:hypothetical protein
MKFGLNCAIPMMALLRLSLLIKILIIGSTKLFLKNLVNLLMIVLLVFFIVCSLCSCGPLAYSDNELAKQLLYALNDQVWGMKISAFEESTDFATLDIEKLFRKFKSHELSRKGRPNHDASMTSKALISNAHGGGHDVNPTNTISSSL